MVARMAMIVTATKASMRVKPFEERCFIVELVILDGRIIDALERSASRNRVAADN